MRKVPSQCFSVIIVAVVCTLSWCVFADAATLTDLQMLGRYRDLEKAAEQKLAASQKEPDASLLGYLCVAYSRLKRYNKLFDCLDKLERRIKSGDYVLETDKLFVANSDGTPLPNMLRAEALIELGQYKEAVREAKTALGKVRDHMTTGIWSPKIYRLSLMGTLGLAHALGGDTKSARTQAEELENFSLGFMGIAFTTTFRANALARVNMALGQYNKAFEYVKDEDSILARSVWFINNVAWGYSGDDAVETVYLTLPKLMIRGKCLSELGNLEEAGKTLDVMLRNARISDNGEIYWLTLFERGRVAEKQGKFPEAIDLYRRAIEVIESQRSTINTETNKIGFVGDKQEVYRRLIASLHASGQYEAAFDYVERSKSRALVDLLAEKQDFSVAGADREKVLQLLDLIKREEQEAVIQDLSPSSSQSRTRSVKTREQIRGQSPELASLVSVTSVPLAELQRLIGADETLVEYYYDDNDVYIFVLSDGILKSTRVKKGALADDIRLLRSLIADPGSGDPLPLCRRLYKQIMGSVEGSLVKPNLVIVPHGVLHYLPFNALHDGQRYLIERCGIRMLPSASVSKYLRTRRPSDRPGVFAFGNPDLGDPKHDLKYAQNEAVAVAASRAGSMVLVREKATETALRKFGAGFNYIHFATHGQFDPDAPLESALLLARDGQSDGRLTVDKLYSMRLEADLVTLSACETGLGKVANGDDVVGLTRGFLYAGSSTVVSSLWKVDDMATSHLMTEFYSALKTTNKQEALRRAQLKTKEKYGHPFFWAAFELTGSAR